MKAENTIGCSHKQQIAQTEKLVTRILRFMVIKNQNINAKYNHILTSNAHPTQNLNPHTSRPAFQQVRLNLNSIV